MHHLCRWHVRREFGEHAVHKLCRGNVLNGRERAVHDVSGGNFCRGRERPMHGL